MYKRQGVITASGYNDSYVYVKVYSENWASLLFNSGMLTNNETQTFEGLEAGSYVVTVQTFDESWATSCNVIEYIKLEDFTQNAVSQGVEILYFTATKEGTSVNLDWTSNTDARTDSYIVERSTDGINFTELLDVNPLTTASNAIYYQNQDIRPSLGYNYYRVLQEFEDGTFRYSNVEKVYFDEDLRSFTVFPNPTTVGTELYLNLKEYTGEPVNITILNSLGQPMYRQSLESAPEEALRVDLAKYKPGVYNVNVKTKSRKGKTKTFVVIQL